MQDVDPAARQPTEAPCFLTHHQARPPSTLDATSHPFVSSHFHVEIYSLLLVCMLAMPSQGWYIAKRVRTDRPPATPRT
jgi:hypothetical protein